MARVPQHFIDQLLDCTDIVSLIDARVSLKKAGSEYTACCPFHDERTPSFTVSPVKQFYHCFGCGAHGSAISFLMEYDRLEFRDAVEVLATNAGLDMPEQAQASDNGPPRDPLYDALARADHYFRSTLRTSEGAVSYLKKRGISGQLAKTYGLGFAPDRWNGLQEVLNDSAAGEQAGLLIARDRGGFFDRFRNRIMFPIRDMRGRTIAFGGRTLGDDKAKYLNSPETPLFHKSNHVYGLYEARQAARDLPRILVVEGYMDVIALAQQGFVNAVATLGTATTESQLTLLFRHTTEVVFCFDGDRAGVQAARKALAQSLPVMRGNRRVRFLFLPEGEDPDTMVRQPNGIDWLRQAIDSATPASAVLIENLTRDIDLESPDGRAQLVEKARESINSMPPEAFRAEMINEIATLARLPADDLSRMYAQGERSGPASRATKGESRQIRTTPVTRALTLLLADPGLARHVSSTNTMKENQAAGVEVLTEAIEFFAADPNISVTRWLERYRDHRYFERLQQLTSETPPGSAEERAAEFLEALRRLNSQTGATRSLRERYDALVAQQANAPLDENHARELKEVFRQLQSIRGNGNA